MPVIRERYEHPNDGWMDVAIGRKLRLYLFYGSFAVLATWLLKEWLVMEGEGQPVIQAVARVITVMGTTYFLGAAIAMSIAQWRIIRGHRLGARVSLKLEWTKCVCYFIVSLAVLAIITGVAELWQGGIVATVVMIVNGVASYCWRDPRP